ncbi:MAG: nucleoside triphosphate pyrophosphohydrolase [Polyangia bacterium]
MTGESRKGAGKGAEAFAEFVRIVHRLRAPDGCPWDREQTPASLKPFIVEEAYEVIDAIDGGGPEDLREELGDLLLQIVLQAEIADEAGDFDIDSVARGISAKLVNRHPHVFGGERVDGSGEVLRNWEQIKRVEKKDRGLFDGLPSFLPALLKASRMGEKAGRVGFDWTDAGEVRAKVDEELAELDGAVAAGDPEAVEHELGDLLFALAQWARHLGRNPEESLRAGCDRFARRFARMDGDLRRRGARMDRLDIEELEQAWQRAKRSEGEE